MNYSIRKGRYVPPFAIRSAHHTTNSNTQIPNPNRAVWNLEFDLLEFPLVVQGVSQRSRRI